MKAYSIGSGPTGSGQIRMISPIRAGSHNVSDPYIDAEILLARECKMNDTDCLILDA